MKPITLEIDTATEKCGKDVQKYVEGLDEEGKQAFGKKFMNFRSDYRTIQSETVYTKIELEHRMKQCDTAEDRREKYTCRKNLSAFRIAKTNYMSLAGR